MATLYQIERQIEAEFVGARLDPETDARVMARARELWPEARSCYIDEAGRLHLVVGSAKVLQFGPSGQH
jgi:hypothetical protein